MTGTVTVEQAKKLISNTCVAIDNYPNVVFVAQLGFSEAQAQGGLNGEQLKTKLRKMREALSLFPEETVVQLSVGIEEYNKVSDRLFNEVKEAYAKENPQPKEDIPAQTMPVEPGTFGTL